VCTTCVLTTISEIISYIHQKEYTIRSDFYIPCLIHREHIIVSLKERVYQFQSRSERLKVMNVSNPKCWSFQEYYHAKKQVIDFSLTKQRFFF
jgi:hypothetical protein